MDTLELRIKNAIREVPDFPKPGINFYDITTVLLNGPLLVEIIDEFAAQYRDKPLDAVVGVEARGFIFGAGLAYALGKPFIPVRKPGKLPADVEQVSYALEYGENQLECHTGALNKGDSALLVDDLLATGGTANASIELAERFGAKITEVAVVVELDFLNGRDALAPVHVTSLVNYSG